MTESTEPLTRCYLVRSLPELIEESIVGVGWSGHNFAEMADAEQAIAEVDAKDEGGVGRAGNQIRRFFEIRAGDIIVAPLAYSVAIGRAIGGIFFDGGYRAKDRANQRRVTFPRDEDGHVRTLLRTNFIEAFQRRLRVPGIVINDLTEFRTDLNQALVAVEQGAGFSHGPLHDQEVAEREEQFKAQLLANIQSGKTYLRTGGLGLELLVKELLELEGYEAEVMSKRAHQGVADADVKASRSDRFGSAELLVQVKHHEGISDDHGLTQLLAIRDREKYQLIFLTSAEVGDDLRRKAEDGDVTVIDGHGLVDWIAEKAVRLDPATKQALGICEVPTVL